MERLFAAELIIKLNSIRCIKCDKTLISNKSGQDIKCSCGSVAIGGGKEFLKRVGDKKNMEELSEYDIIPPFPINFLKLHSKARP
ncbi:hypothetical protein TetV_572 [Tetraselmis virus 1]|uniref:DUF7695 domain-containing protein n=1 Tax=Tetraselmis virus 1 TaxID=2060617 RepID=A0A2P0VP25_9VIRU|nr:hypothetical protein QJ968_gp482 [Tetraselmis virus 1]AUF82654.1 hypothetical protein TetV_572 [Tetraselmis virus 1]